MYSGSALVAIQLSRNLLLVVNIPIHSSFDRMQIFAHSAILKFWQANARAQAKVARAHAQVCQGYTTGYHLCVISTYLVRRRGLQTKECVRAALIHLLEFQSANVAAHGSGQGTHAWNMLFYLEIHIALMNWLVFMKGIISHLQVATEDAQIWSWSSNHYIVHGFTKHHNHPNILDNTIWSVNRNM